MNLKFSVIFVMAATLALVIVPAYAEYDNLSLKEQSESGVAPESIVCREEMQLMLKSNGDPVCIFKSSVEKMTERGYATIVPDVMTDAKITSKDKVTDGEDKVSDLCHMLTNTAQQKSDSVYQHHGRGWSTDNHLIWMSHARAGNCGNYDGPCFRNSVSQPDFSIVENLQHVRHWPDRTIYSGETVEWDYTTYLDGREVDPITVTDSNGKETSAELGHSDNRSGDTARHHTFEGIGTYVWHMPDHLDIQGTITVVSEPSEESIKDADGTHERHDDSMKKDKMDDDLSGLCHMVANMAQHENDIDQVYQNHGRGGDNDHHLIWMSHARAGNCGNYDGPCFRNSVSQPDFSIVENLEELRYWPDRTIYRGETVEWDYVSTLGGREVAPIIVTDSKGNQINAELGSSYNRYGDAARHYTFDAIGTFVWYMPDYLQNRGVITVLPNPQGESVKDADDTHERHDDNMGKDKMEDGAPGPSAPTFVTTLPVQNTPKLALDDAEFTFHWEIDPDLISGYTSSSDANKQLEIKFLNEKVSIPDHSFALVLQHDYGILLSNEGEEWSNSHAFALVETLRTIPQTTRDSYSEQNLELSKWILYSDSIADDIRIDSNNSQNIVTISDDAFENANPKIAEIDGKKGKYFSQRLHHALVLYVTDYGKDYGAVEKILNERYGVTTKISDYSSITKNTTDETASDFQKFSPTELVTIINIFEEMPTGFHSIPELDSLVRRADGTVHPLYPSAPAVAWTQNGYIEFMESAFTSNDRYIHRLILHEKAHFMWHWLFSESLRQDWIKLGGWYQSDDTWHTTQTTKFVSSYAHLKNPDEDMAESIAFFITNPDKLKSRADDKYEFVRDRIMQGNYYISQIREDLTFDVYNLYPDYVYPGKIISVDVAVSGEPHEDKTLSVQIVLNGDNKFEGAKHAYMRIFSEVGTFVDMYLYPVKGSSGSVLKGEITLDSSVYSGYWYVNQIRVTDIHGNQRFEGQNDFGWKMHIQSPGLDSVPPKYVPHTLKTELRTDSESYSRQVQILEVSWEISEDRVLDTCLARIDHKSAETYSTDSYGTFDENTNRCTAEFVITEYHISGNYLVTMLSMYDMAGNNSYVTKSDLTGNSIHITTSDPDITPPYLDTDNIQIHARPTNPDTPNGETIVEITYRASDDKSGLDMVNYTLMDPQGLEHFEYHYHDNFRTVFFEGKPDVLAEYKIDIVLPEGSPPGKWGLAEMTLADKATNKKSYQFTEIIHFEVDK